MRLISLLLIICQSINTTLQVSITFTILLICCNKNHGQNQGALGRELTVIHVF